MSNGEKIIKIGEITIIILLILVFLLLVIKSGYYRDYN